RLPGAGGLRGRVHLRRPRRRRDRSHPRRGGAGIRQPRLTAPPVVKILALVLLLLPWSLPAVAADQAALQAAVARSGLPVDSLSLLAVEHGRGADRELLAVNAQAPRIPASVTKLITAAAVLRD